MRCFASHFFEPATNFFFENMAAHEGTKRFYPRRCGQDAKISSAFFRAAGKTDATPASHPRRIRVCNAYHGINYAASRELICVS